MCVRVCVCVFVFVVSFLCCFLSAGNVDGFKEKFHYTVVLLVGY